MPRTGFKKSPTLAIELDGDLSTHLPGDTLIGYVVFEKPPQERSSYSSPIRLKLFGRVKIKYERKAINHISITRGRAVLFEESVLLNKSKICQDGENAWLFSITIPKSSQHGFAGRVDESKPGPYQGYLHTIGEDKKEVDVNKHCLPSVFYRFSESAMSGKTVEAYIEYVLVASYGENTAYHPIYVRNPSVQSLITDYKMRMYSDYILDLIKTLKLLPEHTDKKLTFCQKSSRFFRSEKMPKYTYSVKVEYPKVVQFEYPDPIPLKIHLVPNLDPKQTTICPENDISNLPPVQVVSIEMKLKGHFSIRCPGTLWDTDTIKNHTFPFSFPLAINPVTIPVIPASVKVPYLKQVATAPEQLPELSPPLLKTASPMLGPTLTAPFSMSETASFTSEAITAVPGSDAALSHVASAPLVNTKIN